MKAAKAISVVLSLLVVLPIWFYLLHQLLVRVNASELMWFLYWAYLPIAMLCGLLSRLAEAK